MTVSVSSQMPLVLSLLLTITPVLSAAVNSQTSLVLSLLLTVGLFAGLQLLKSQLTASPLLTVVTGGLCSLLFLLLLTAVGNLEATLFGKGFQTKLLEVVLCLAMACTAAGMIHRVCVTVW